MVEFAVTAWDDLNWEGPEHSRRSVLEAGRIIGLQVLVYDQDSDNDLEIFSLAISTVTAEATPRSTTFTHDLFADNFVDGLLIPCDRGDCGSVPPGGTAVRTDSWGRIKARNHL